MLEIIALNMFSAATYDVIKARLSNLYQKVAATHPQLETQAKEAVAAGNLAETQRVFEEATNRILAEAADGSIIVDGVVMSALEQLKFDHQNGTIEIAGAILRSTVLITGGSTGASGQTVVGENTSMQSSGTAIEVGKGASIVMTGGASIKQT